MHTLYHAHWHNITAHYMKHDCVAHDVIHVYSEQGWSNHGNASCIESHHHTNIMLITNARTLPSWISSTIVSARNLVVANCNAWYNTIITVNCYSAIVITVPGVS